MNITNRDAINTNDIAAQQMFELAMALNSAGHDNDMRPDYQGEACQAALNALKALVGDERYDEILSCGDFITEAEWARKQLAEAEEALTAAVLDKAEAEEAYENGNEEDADWAEVATRLSARCAEYSVAINRRNAWREVVASFAA